MLPRCGTLLTYGKALVTSRLRSPVTGNLTNSAPSSKHSNVIQLDRWEIGEFVHYLPHKKNFCCLPNCCYCVDRARNLPGPAPNHVLTVLLQISSKSVHFRRNYSRLHKHHFYPIEYFHDSPKATLRANKNYANYKNMTATNKPYFNPF